MTVASQGWAQIGNPPGPDEEAVEEPSIEPAPVEMYKIISLENDTTHVDTSLTISDYYRFNYLRKDIFGLLPFPNTGQPYTYLTRDFSRKQPMVFPHFGSDARTFGLMNVTDIPYYYVPTPFTELYFKTVYEQGQTLDALFTVNLSPEFNFSIAYKGLRSLGKYRSMLVSSGNFRTTASYHTENGRYRLKTHFVSQDLMNEESGGLGPQALEQYLSKDPEFEDRSRLEMNFEETQSTTFGKRFFLRHSFDLFATPDTLAFPHFRIGHIIKISDKEYHFQQAASNPFFGPSFEDVDIRDIRELETVYNEAFADFRIPILGKIRGSIGYMHYNYGYNSVLNLGDGFIQNRLLGNTISAGAGYAKEVGDFYLEGEGTLNIRGAFDGYHLGASAGYKAGSDLFFVATAELSSHAPDFNFLLHQSDYIEYNWQTTFSNEESQVLSVAMSAPRIVRLEASYSRLQDMTYFGKNSEGFVKPFQASGMVEYFKIEGSREFRLGKFALDNRLLYQEVLQGVGYLNLPSLVSRNTLYFTDQWFRRALFLQTGLSLNYFTDFEMNGYDPVLGEFYVQNEMDFSGIPSVDFFFNGKIRTARIFFQLEHLNSLITGNDFLVAPGYPYRDFAVRFGLVWNFFM